MLVIEYTRTDVADGTVIIADDHITKITSQIAIDVEENTGIRFPTDKDVPVKQVIKLQVINCLSQAHNKLAARWQLVTRALILGLNTVVVVANLVNFHTVLREHRVPGDED